MEMRCGKVMDIEMLSKFCTFLDKVNHDRNCPANYQVYSGGMEAARANEIFHRSVPKYGVRYVQYLGDGDTNSFAGVAESNHYGDDCPVKNLNV